MPGLFHEHAIWTQVLMLMLQAVYRLHSILYPAKASKQTAIWSSSVDTREQFRSWNEDGNSKSNAAGQLREGHMGSKKNRHLLRAHSRWVGEGILWNKYGQVTLLLSLLLSTVFWVTSFSSPAMKFGNLEICCIFVYVWYGYTLYIKTLRFLHFQKKKTPKDDGQYHPPSRTRTSNRWERYLFVAIKHRLSHQWLCTNKMDA